MIDRLQDGYSEYEENIDPCDGCGDNLPDGGCKSNGGCARASFGDLEVDKD